MPLKSIKQYLEKRSVEELNIILLEQKNNIERQIQELNRTNNIIKNKLDILQSYKSIELDKMVIENMEEELCAISCDFDKISTITKVLIQTLVENSDFEIRDTQNLCSILLKEVKNTKNKLNNFEKTFSNSCLIVP